MSEEKRRGRAANYTNKEKVVFLNLVQKHKDVIESKKNDFVTTKQKYEAWREVYEQFNRIAPNQVERSLESLRKFYDNLKKKYRREYAETSHEPAKEDNKNTGLEIMMKILNNTQQQSITDEECKDIIITDVKCAHDFSCVDDTEIEMLSFDDYTSQQTLFESSWPSSHRSEFKSPASNKFSPQQNPPMGATNPAKPPQMSLPQLEFESLHDELTARRERGDLEVEMARMKRDALQEEIRERRERDKVEFELRRQILELDVQIKREQLRKMLN